MVNDFFQRGITQAALGRLIVQAEAGNVYRGLKSALDQLVRGKKAKALFAAKGQPAVIQLQPGTGVEFIALQTIQPAEATEFFVVHDINAVVGAQPQPAHIVFQYAVNGVVGQSMFFSITTEMISAGL